MMYHYGTDNTNSKKRVVSYRRNGKEILVPTNERLCVDCGGIFVAKKDCHKIKASMDKALETADDVMRGAKYG
jgi:hypothetical protein